MASASESTSLEARISKPEGSEVVSASTDNSDSKKPTSTGEDVTRPTEKPEDGNLAKAQTDGAGPQMGGTTGIYEPEYDVDVKLSDVQADPNNPLFSIKSFEELGL